jgi:molybdenum cofactor biosynthesis protein A
MLIDSFGRKLTYLRMAITDRCNLRCHYCMPMQGLEWMPRKEMLTYEEMLRLCHIFSGLGVEKIRFTGGEPTLRKDFDKLVRHVHQGGLFKSMHLTTNGTRRLWNPNEELPLIWKSVNVSLDSLDPVNFHKITGRHEWHSVMETIQKLLSNGIPVRVNVVVMTGQNDHEIMDFVQWAMDTPIDIRFIEEMPFNGAQGASKLIWNSHAILEHIQRDMALIPVHPMEAGETASYYTSPSMKGRVGIIAAYTRSFCGTCNRLRITPQGVLRTCLYSDQGLQLRDALRAGLSNEEIQESIRLAVTKKERNGFEAEALRTTAVSESMAAIGG